MKIKTLSKLAEEQSDYFGDIALTFQKMISENKDIIMSSDNENTESVQEYSTLESIVSFEEDEENYGISIIFDVISVKKEIFINQSSVEIIFYEKNNDEDMNLFLDKINELKNKKKQQQ
jgi:hypothetical protein